MNFVFKRAPIIFQSVEVVQDRTESEKLSRLQQSQSEVFGLRLRSWSDGARRMQISTTTGIWIY
jgi:hypothetical protein